MARRGEAERALPTICPWSPRERPVLSRPFAPGPTSLWSAPPLPKRRSPTLPMNASTRMSKTVSNSRLMSALISTLIPQTSGPTHCRVGWVETLTDLQVGCGSLPGSAMLLHPTFAGLSPSMHHAARHVDEDTRGCTEQRLPESSSSPPAPHTHKDRQNLALQLHRADADTMHSNAQ